MGDSPYRSDATGGAEQVLSGARAVEVAPITDADVLAVSEFLHAEFLNLGFSRARAAADWQRAMTPPWHTPQPNHGYLLRKDGRVVGAYLAMYSERTIGGTTHRICNLGVWCVAAQHRAAGLRMLRALLRQRGLTFTDLTANPSVRALNARLGFVDLATTTVLVPNIPWPVLSRKVRIIDDADDIARTLSGRERRVFQDHAATVAHHVGLTEGPRSCWVMYRRDRYRGLPLFATVLHVSDAELFRRRQQYFYRYLLLRMGIPATLTELRVAGHRPPMSVAVPGRSRMYLSDVLSADEIDYLYSELTCLE